MEVAQFAYKKPMFVELFTVTGNVIQSNGMDFVSVKKEWVIPYFKGVMSLSRLPIKIMTDDIFDSLQERGKKFLNLAKGAHYMQYTGNIYRRSWWSTTFFKRYIKHKD